MCEALQVVSAYAPMIVISNLPNLPNCLAVSILEALNPEKPNALQLLGKELVAWRTDEGEWVCMDDQCSHRLAPLSGTALPSCTCSRAICCAIMTNPLLNYFI